jgi:hypothetical protein
MSHIAGPWKGRCCNALLYQESKLQDRLREVNQVCSLENHYDDLVDFISMGIQHIVFLMEI